MYNGHEFNLHFIDVISRLLGRINSYLIIPVTLLVIAEVISRYLFNAPNIWTEELALYFCMYIYMIGGAWVHSIKGHVTVDAIYIRLSRKTQAIMDVAVTFPFTFVFCAVLVWFGSKWAWGAMIGGQTSGSLWDPAIWPVKAVIPIGAFLMLLQGFLRLVRDLKVAIGSDAGGN